MAWEKRQQADLVLMVSGGVLLLTWFLSWLSLHVNFSNSFPEMFGFPGFSQEFNFDVYFSFWWVRAVINGETDMASWFEGMDDMEVAWFIAANLAVIIGLVTMILHFVLAERRPGDSNTAWLGWATAALFPAAMILYAIGIDQNAGEELDPSAFYILAWIASFGVGIGMGLRVSALSGTETDAPSEKPANG